MTLILAVGNPDHVTQVSDRLLTGPDGPRILPRNKAIEFRLSDARLACGYAGLAGVGGASGFRTEDWLIDTLMAAAPPDYQAQPTLHRFVDLATQEFTSNELLRAIPAEDQRLSVMFTGYLYSVEPPLLVAALVTNFQDYQTGLDADTAWDDFRILFLNEKRPAPEPVPTYLQRIGVWEATLPEDMESLRALLGASEAHDAITQQTIEIMREIASRPEAAGTVGKDLTSITLFRDPSIPTIVGDHPRAGQTERRGAATVIAQGPEAVLAIKDMVVKEVAPTTPTMNTSKTGRNETCPCGSGKKFKNCCGR